MSTVVFSMTLDPEGAMHDWVDLPEGWSLVPVPTQEAIHLLGAQGYQELLVQLCEQEHPALLVSHPPYDFLTPQAADRMRAAGTRLVGYAFDDEIFAASYSPRTWQDLRQIYDRYVTTREVPWATAPRPALPELVPQHDVVLVGRAYARRRQMVEALRQAGIGVKTRGHGWPGGFTSRKELEELYARAAVVLTTADWEQRAVPMVKHRLLDAAMLGVCQIAQDAPDLRRYFPEEEVLSFCGPEDLVLGVRQLLADPAGRRTRARAARRRALAEHTWSRRFTELLGPLAGELAGGSEPEPPAGSRSFLLYDQLLLSLATRAEADGRAGAAAALARTLLRRHPTQSSAAAVLGRCLRDLGEAEDALPWLRLAARAAAPPAAASLHALLPHQGVGTGLGRLGLLPPAAEPLIYLLATLVELGRLEEALAECDTLLGPAAPVLAAAVAASLQLGDDPAYLPLSRRLEQWAGR